MRIALITDGIFPYVIGGMQKHSYYLAKYFAKKGVYIDLYHTNRSEKDIDRLELFTEEEKKFIHAIVVPFPVLTRLPGHYLKASYLYSQLILDEFKKRPPVDFIYTKGFSGWKMIEDRAKGKFKTDASIGINFHGYEMFQLQPSLKSKIQSSVLLKRPVEYLVKNADRVFSYGGKITEIIERIGVNKNKIIEIPTGIEKNWLAEGIRASSTERRFIFVGRYERRKGIEELMIAIKKISKEIKFEFLFVGDIPERKRIRSEQVKYYGAIHDAAEMRSLIRSCDVLICPSFSEGMPNVILEAMASGLAIIASDVGAVPLLVSSENGILIKPSDAAALERSIRSFINAKAEDLDKMKRVSLSKVRSGFLWENVIDDTISKINDVIADTSR